MKKVIKSRIFLIIVLCIISCGIGVYAAVTYKASDVLYTSSDGTSMTVNDALNELYNKKSNNYGYCSSYKDGTAVYYNPVTGEVCTDYVESNSTTGKKTGCMKWYIFNDTSESSTVNMILDHNTTAKLAWNTSNTNVAYGSSNIIFEVVRLVNVSKWVNSPRLISAEEVAQITGNTNFDSTNYNTWFYLDSNSQTQTAKSQGASKYAWLFDYTNGCTIYGCNVADSSNFGYWTSTTCGAAGSGGRVWIVDSDGRLVAYYTSNVILGVRPVISISKSKLS